MRLLGLTAFVASCSLMTVLGSETRAQDLPLVIVSSSGPGGMSDSATRILARSFSEALGISTVVENRPGGGGALADDFLKNAAADGSTLGTRLLAHGQGGKILENLSLIGSVAQFDPILFTSEDSMLGDIAAVAASTDELTIAIQNNSASGRAALREILRSGDFPIGDVLRLDSPATAVIQGDAQIGIALFPQDLPDGVQILGLLAEERSMLLPDVPTTREFGLDLIATSEFVVLAPEGIGADAVETFQNNLELAASSPEFASSMQSVGATRTSLKIGGEFRSQVETANNDFCEICDCDDDDDCRRHCAKCD